MKKPPYEETPLKEFIKSYQDLIISNAEGRPIFSEWEYIVGETLYNHVFLQEIVRSKMIVKCEHPAYKSLFRMNERQIMARLQEKFPEYNIKTIQVY